MIDLLQYIKGDGRIYDVNYKFYGGPGEGTERMQTQHEGKRFYHVKGGPDSHQYNWEELWHDETYIYRGTDISPEQGQLYQSSEEGRYGQRWIPRYASIGTRHLASPTITFRYKSNGNNVQGKPPYLFPHWVEVKAIHKQYRFESGIVLNDVLELWGYLHDPSGNKPGVNFERYFYAKGYGLVSWHDPTKPNNWRSFIAREKVSSQDLRREVIPWLKLPPIGDITVSYPKDVPFSDPNWQVAIATSNGTHTNIRRYPSTSTAVIGIIQNKTKCLLNVARQEKRSDGIWYPIRINSQPNKTNYDLFGWIRSDVFTYTSQNNSGNSELVSATVKYNPSDSCHTRLIGILNQVVQQLRDSGAEVS